MRKILLIFCAWVMFPIASEQPILADPVNSDNSSDANIAASLDDLGRTTPFPGIGKRYPMSVGDTNGAPIDETAPKNKDALKSEEKPQVGYDDAKVATSPSTVSSKRSVAGEKKDASPGKSKPVSLEPRETALATGKGAGQSYGNVQSPKGTYFIQVGAFGKRENAEQFRKLLQSKYPDVIASIWESNADHLYRVHLGSFPTESEAHRYREILKGDNRPGVVVRKE